MVEFELPVADVILQFTILVTAALVVQLTVERMHLPGLIGLLLIGMLIGPGGAGILPREPVVELLGRVGLVYIMFLAGVEINLDVVKRHKQEAAAFGLLAFSLSIVPAIAVGALMGLPWGGALLLGTALSSHTLLAYPIVKRLGLVNREPVVTAIGGTLLTDTLALVLLAVVIQTTGTGEDTGWHWLVSLLLLIGVVAISLPTVPRIARFVFGQAKASRAEKALFVLVVLLVLASVTELIGTEAILGAFLAGLCLNRPLTRRDELHEHLGFVGRMLFIPFFFIDTGMRLELEVFAGHYQVWLLAGLLLVVVLLGKGSSSWLIGRIYGYSRRDRVVMIGLTVPQAAATLAVTVTARREGLLDEKTVDAVIVVIFVTCLLGPLLSRFAGRRLADDRQEGPNEVGEEAMQS